MTINTKAFQIDGLVFKGNASATTSGNISDVEVGIFTDADGNMIFKDQWITDILNKDSITFQELYTRVKGIYSKQTSDGVGLYFKDQTVSREYSLKELINASQSWRKYLTNGSLWWMGKSSLDHSKCANLPRESDPNGPNRTWSIDKFLAEFNSLPYCASIVSLSNFEKTVDPLTGEPRWWDIQALELVLPPFEEEYKAAIIMSKLAFAGYNITEPILFRLYDASTGVELTRTAVLQGNGGKTSFPVSLNYFGTLPGFANTGRFDTTGQPKNNSDCNTDCGCQKVECVNNDLNCVSSAVEKLPFENRSHLIKVQFRVVDYHPDHYERQFGIEIDNGSGGAEYVTTSTLDAVLFNIDPTAKVPRLHGTVEFNRDFTEYEVLFDSATDSTSYSINLSCSANVNIWWTDKKTTGFKIKSELPFVGSVDWTLMNVGGGSI